MSVREILRGKGGQVVSIDPNLGVGAAVSLLLRHQIGGLPVVERSGKLVGFIAERDVARLVDAHPGSIRDLTIRDAMRRPPPTCSIDDALHNVMTRMTRDRLRHLVVLDGDELAGVISVGDLVNYRLQQLEVETGVLRDIVAAQRAGGRG